MALSRINSRILLTTLLAMGIAILGGAEPLGMDQEEAIDYARLRFAPPDGTTCRREMLITKTTRIGDEEVESKATKLENTIIYRTSPTRTSITIRPRQGAAARRRMETLGAFAGGILTTSDITINYDSEGRFLSLSGLKRASEALRDAVPKQFRPLIDEMLPMVLANFRTRWEHRFHQFTNRDFPIGKFGSEKRKLALPNGQSIDITAEFSAREQGIVEGKNLVRLFNGYTSTDPALGDFMGDFILSLLTTGIKGFKHPDTGEAIERLESEFPKFVIDQLWVINERYLESSTMIPHYETDTLTVRMTVQDAQGDLEAAIRNITEYKYDCS